MTLHCRNFDCENRVGSTYYSVTRIKMPGNQRKRYTFCSLKCLLNFVNKWEESQNG